MNILIDALPEEIDGVSIYSRFQNMVQFELMLGDPEIPDGVKVPTAIDLLYKEPVHDLQKAIDGLLWFYRCGKPEDQTKGKPGHTDRAYDFEVDAPDIYAAFMQAYGIDLNDSELHWWKFRALLDALPEECKITKVMGYRTMDLSKFKGEEKRFYQEKKDFFRLKPLDVEKLPLEAAEQTTLDRVNARFAAAKKWAAERSKP